MFRYPPNSEPGHSHQFGYWAEQIMSTTLFNLYRCLGGDAAAVEEREIAADQAVYLIIQAIGLLGCSQAGTAREVVDYACALKSTDAATTTLWLPLDSAATPRLGGAAAKPVRWCFEQQGLYAAPARRALTTRRGSRPTSTSMSVQATTCRCAARFPSRSTGRRTAPVYGISSLRSRSAIEERRRPPSATFTLGSLSPLTSRRSNGTRRHGWPPPAPGSPYMNLANKLSIGAGLTGKREQDFHRDHRRAKGALLCLDRRHVPARPIDHRSAHAPRLCQGCRATAAPAARRQQPRSFRRRALAALERTTIRRTPWEQEDRSERGQVPVRAQALARAQARARVRARAQAMAPARARLFELLPRVSGSCLGRSTLHRRHRSRAPTQRRSRRSMRSASVTMTGIRRCAPPTPSSSSRPASGNDRRHRHEHEMDRHVPG